MPGLAGDTVFLSDRVAQSERRFNTPVPNAWVDHMHSYPHSADRVAQCWTWEQYFPSRHFMLMWRSSPHAVLQG